MNGAIRGTHPDAEAFKNFTDDQVVANMIFVSHRTWVAIMERGGENGHMIVMCAKCPFVIDQVHGHDFHSYDIVCSHDMSQDHHCHQYDFAIIAVIVIVVLIVIVVSEVVGSVVVVEERVGAGPEESEQEKE